MKSNLLITALLALSSLAGTYSAHAQGSLTPPAGPPTATSHTINEVYDKAATIEGQNTAQTTKIDSIQTQVTNLSVRRPLIAGAPGVTISANGTITVTLPGSYYLTNNKLISSTGAHGISVFARDVTIDLNGFALQCGSGTGGSAIFLDSVAGARQVRISNGFICGGSTWNGTTFTAAGWTNGISGAAADVSISDVTIDGMRNHGIDCVNAAVSNCNVTQCVGSGIRAMVVDRCRVTKCSAGIYAGQTVDRSYGESVAASFPGSGDYPRGIYAIPGIVTNSTGVGNLGVGIAADIVSHSKGTSVSSTGVSASESADFCIGISTSGSGIDTSMASNCRAQASGSSTALMAQIASYCFCTSYGSGPAMIADIAVASTKSNGSTDLSVNQKFLGSH
jgi:hypothetical protein